MEIFEANAKADCAEFVAELHSLNAEVFRNLTALPELDQDSCPAPLEDCNLEVFEASIDSWQSQFHQTKEAHDAYASKLEIFVDKHGGQQLEDVAQILLENATEMHKMMNQLCEEMELLKERFDSICESIGERVAAFGAVVFEGGEDFEDETWSDDEDYEAERDQPKRQRGQNPVCGAFPDNPWFHRFSLDCARPCFCAKERREVKVLNLCQKSTTSRSFVELAPSLEDAEDCWERGQVVVAGLGRK
ncbi:hypothetical protein quinque_012266 [Culex quinquefasciatus]